MPTTLPVIHRAAIDRQSEIVQHAHSPACPRGMLELNPAFGCQFQCAYCGIYAMEREYYGEVIVHDGFAAYLDRWLAANRTALPGCYFYVSAKTDIFQPALLDSGITLDILKILHRHDARYFLVTKGGLPPPDIRRALVDGRRLNQVIISATMPDEAWRAKLEPAAPTMDDRLAFAKFCVESGIFVTASCCPVLPIRDRVYLKETVARFAAVGVRHFYFDVARLSRPAVSNLIELLPEQREEFENCYFHPEARVTRWHLPHRHLTIDKLQPPVSWMLETFRALADCVREVTPAATVSVCNHFATPSTLPHFNDRASARCISCLGHRFAPTRN